MKILTIAWSLTPLLFALAAVRAGAAPREEQATFAGGCFWNMVPPFEEIDGVTKVVSGYTGGRKENPTSKEVSSGTTGHVQAIQVTYDPTKVSYAKLLELFWRQIDPTDASGQFVDRGPQYLSAIFTHSDEQRRLAHESRRKLGATRRFAKPIVTEIRAASTFWPAEEYHQDYAKRNPIRYRYYRWGSGRDEFLDKVWGKDRMEAAPEPVPGSWHTFVRPSKEELRKRLTPIQFKVTQEEGTERAFENEYHDTHREGIYVDIVSGEPLFSSRDKYESGTGWPSFTRPIEPGLIVLKEDRSLFSTRTEVRSRHGDSHLGHLFDDGPLPTGKRYCVNSAALRFIPLEEMEKAGYGDYLLLFGRY